MELHKAMHQMDTDSKVAMARLEGKIEGLGTQLVANINTLEARIDGKIDALGTQVDALKESSDSTRKKVEDLVRWKTLILGGAVAIGVLISALFGLVVKFGDRFSMDAKPSIPAPATPPAKPSK
jgi:hypothetical protein